jgi:outer membrane protein assembly factor BamE (lipoprotein component of BamABCDE complex)
MFTRLTLALLFLSLCACASMVSLPKSLDNVRAGMDKDQVLGTAGNPKRTFRSNSQDHWIYVFFKNHEEFSREITFEDGKVVRVTKALAKQDWGKELEGLSESKTTGGFKTIDGGPEDVNQP